MLQTWRKTFNILRLIADFHVRRWRRRRSSYLTRMPNGRPRSKSTLWTLWRTPEDTSSHFFVVSKSYLGCFLLWLFVRSSPSATGAGISKPHLDVSLTRWCLCLNLTRADAQRCDERSLEDSTCYYFLQEMFWVDIHSCGCVEQQEAHLGTESKQTWWNNM